MLCSSAVWYCSELGETTLSFSLAPQCSVPLRSGTAPSWARQPSPPSPPFFSSSSQCPPPSPLLKIFQKSFVPVLCNWFPTFLCSSPWPHLLLSFCSFGLLRFSPSVPAALLFASFSIFWSPSPPFALFSRTMLLLPARNCSIAVSFQHQTQVVHLLVLPPPPPALLLPHHQLVQLLPRLVPLLCLTLLCKRLLDPVSGSSEFK